MKKMAVLTISILFCTLLSAPPNNTGVVFVSEGVNPFEGLYQAIRIVESSCNPFAVGDKHLKNWSYGEVQIRQSRLDDYYRQTGVRYSTDDMFDPAKAKRVFMFYASQNNPYELMKISREWNGGSRGMQKKSTKPYWKKVKQYL